MKPIGTLGTIETVTIGPRVFTDLANLIKLHGYVKSNTYSTFRSTLGPSGYQVTSGKTLTLGAASVSSYDSTVPSTVRLGYGDTDVGPDSSSGPTNMVEEYGDNDQHTGALRFNAVSQITQPNPTADYAINFAVAATKYPYSRHTPGTTQTIQVYGYEA